MDKLRTSAWVIGSQKKLENIPNSIQGLNSFSATIWAGRCGRLLSNIRSREVVTREQLEVFANSAGILTLELETYIRLLEKKGLVNVKRAPDGDIERIEDCLLTKEEVLSNTSDLFQSKAKDLELANIDALEKTAEYPLEENELKQHLFQFGYSDNLIDTLLPLQENFHLLQGHSGYGLSDKYFFNEYIWGDKPNKIIGAIGDLNLQQRTEVQEIIEKIKNQQGKPFDNLNEYDVNVKKLMLKVGLIDIVSINTVQGDEKGFITTPQMWGTKRLELISDDILDDIKVFLNSIRYGEFYGKIGTGRVENPIALVSALVTRDQVGACSAIGTDYIMLEKAGIVDIQRATTLPGKQYFMKLLKKEVGAYVLEILKHGFLLPGTMKKQKEFDFPPAISYKDPETNRIKTKIVTKETKEAFSSMILKMRSI